MKPQKKSPKLSAPAKKLSRERKLVKLIDKIRDDINRAGLNLPELMALYIQLSYETGASLVDDKRLLTNLAYLEKSHLKEPSIGKALLLQSAYMRRWVFDDLNTQELKVPRRKSE